MADQFSKEERSEIMRRVRSKDTNAELVVRSLLHRAGFRFTLHRKDLPGRPDIVLPKYETVIFVHGCFWHRHKGCKGSSTPMNNFEYWQKKFARNMARDRVQKQKLRTLGWKVLVFWECQTGNMEKLNDRITCALEK